MGIDGWGGQEWMGGMGLDVVGWMDGMEQGYLGCTEEDGAGHGRVGVDEGGWWLDGAGWYMGLNGVDGGGLGGQGSYHGCQHIPVSLFPLGCVLNPRQAQGSFPCVGHRGWPERTLRCP